MMTAVKPSGRLDKLPTYVFAELDLLKADARQRGMDLIDLGMGNPDLPTPAPIVEVIANAVKDPANHRYPTFTGKPEFRDAIVRWMERRYGVDMDPDSEVQPLIGSKEGLAHLTFAYVDTGDISIVPTPYYPVHGRATWLAGGEVFELPLKAEEGFAPNLDAIPAEVAQRAKIFFMNYPNNPTTATVDAGFLQDFVNYCKEYGIVAVSDLAYGEIAYDGYQPPSIFQIPGAKSIAVEFHSFSKTFNMAGWRIGFAVGNADIIHTLHSLKTNLDYGVSGAVQDGATYALNHAEKFIPQIAATYQDRRDVVVAGFRELGWPVDVPKASMYVWLPVPEGHNSKSWCTYLIDETGVVVTPGMAFGSGGEGFFRVSLVSPKTTLQQALQRLKDKGIRYQ